MTYIIYWVGSFSIIFSAFCFMFAVYVMQTGDKKTATDVGAVSIVVFTFGLTAICSNLLAAVMSGG